MSGSWPTVTVFRFSPSTDRNTTAPGSRFDFAATDAAIIPFFAATDVGVPRDETSSAATNRGDAGSAMSRTSIARVSTLTTNSRFDAASYAAISAADVDVPWPCR